MTPPSFAGVTGRASRLFRTASMAPVARPGTLSLTRGHIKYRKRHRFEVDELHPAGAVDWADRAPAMDRRPTLPESKPLVSLVARQIETRSVTSYGAPAADETDARTSGRDRNSRNGSDGDAAKPHDRQNRAASSSMAVTRTARPPTRSAVQAICLRACTTNASPRPRPW
jgi:hypothetical protein